MIRVKTIPDWDDFVSGRDDFGSRGPSENDVISMFWALGRVILRTGRPKHLNYYDDFILVWNDFILVFSVSMLFIAAPSAPKVPGEDGADHTWYFWKAKKAK